MRAGGCTVQQALTPDAAAVVKQSVGLARRRGHAQVTPLHVASTMLSSSAGLLRSACLCSSHSHPLQCKALELCFNVALNRLPASSSSSPILGGPHHYYPPSLSNALVAAFKRAQAHQRRGSAESQQQPLLAVKIELEQLVVSVLDDPSVSRVMREAGFSSTQVKANVEQAVALENPNPSKPAGRPRSEDVTSIIDGMVGGGGRRSVVVVGECLSSTEGAVRGVMDRVEKGQVPEGLRNLQFITLPLCSFRKLRREEVEEKIGELRRLLESCCRGVGGGAVVYLGDLSPAAESNGGRKGYYCPLEHVIMEIGGLASCQRLFGGESVRFWVMGVATYQTYMRCRSSLESVLGLHAITIPAGGLELSLNSNSQSLLKSKRSEDQLTCCSDCSRKFEKEAQSLPNSCSSSYGSMMITSTLPSWLQQYKEENKRATNDDQESLQHLRKKWNSIRDSTHKHRPHMTSEITLHFSSASPSSSISSYDQLVEGRFVHRSRLDANPNPNSTSSSDTMEMEYLPRFKEINAENLKILCDALEKKVSWQKNIIPEITGTILRCRSGMMRRKESLKISRVKEDSWLFFQGGDFEGKEKIARELASLVFGSHSNLVSIELNTFSSSTGSDSTDELRNKRSRSEASHSYLERFSAAIRENPHRVFLVEDIEQVDSYSRMGIKRAIERGSVRDSSGEEISVSDAIIILSCDSFDSRSSACPPQVKQKIENKEAKDDDDKEIGSSVCLDLNLCAVEEDEEDCSFSDVGLLELVDRVFFFELPEDL